MQQQQQKLLIPLSPALFDLINKNWRLTTPSILDTVFPHATIANAPDLLIQTDGAAGGDIQTLIVQGALPQQGNSAERRLPVATVRIILLLTGAVVQGVEVDAVLEGALLDEGALGDTLVGVDQAVSKAEGADGRGAGICSGLGWTRIGQVDGAEDQDVADAFGGAVFADDFGGVGGDAAHASQSSPGIEYRGEKTD